MRSLNSLPTEILLNIMDELQDEKETVLSLCLLSRQFRDIAQPVLYHTIELDFQYQVGLMYYLARTLLKRTDLANLFRKIRLGAAWPRIESPGGPAGLPWIDISEYIKSHCATDATDPEAKALHAQLEAGWTFQAMRSRGSSAMDLAAWYTGEGLSIAGIIFSLAENLKAIKMSDTGGNDWSFGEHTRALLFRLFPAQVMIPQSEGNTHKDLIIEKPDLLQSMVKGFRNAQSLHIGQTEMRMLNLPFESLKQLDLDLPFDTSRHGPSEAVRWQYVDDVYRQYRTIRSVTIHGRWIKYHFAYPMLELDRWFKRLGCTELKSFSFLLESSPKYNGPLPKKIRGTINFVSHLVRNLISVESSLERLQLDGPKDFVKELLSPPALQGPEIPPIHFAQFTRLKHIQIPQDILDPFHYPTDPRAEAFNARTIFPYTLESLSITAPNRKVLQWMDSIVQNLSALPSLKEITLHCQWDRGKPANWFMNAHSEIIALQSAGITIAIIQEGIDPTGAGSHEPDIWVGVWSDTDWRTSIFGADY